MLATLALFLSPSITPPPLETAHIVPASATDKESVEKGAHFRVVAHFDAPKLAQDALATAEAAWSACAEVFGEIQVTPDTLLEVNLYRNTADYEVADQRFAGGKFAANLSFSTPSTKACYIAVQPDLSNDALAKVGLTLLTRQVIAHEAAHVYSYRAWNNTSTQPLWIGEGAAQWISKKTMTSGRWIADPAEDPMLATFSSRVKDLESAHKLPTLASILDDKIGELDLNERYAVWLAAFEFLHEAQHAKLFPEIVAAARRIGSGPDHGARLARDVRGIIGDDAALTALDGEFKAFVHAQNPRWSEVYRSLSTSGTTWFQTAFESVNAIAWRTEMVATDNYELSGEVEIYDGPAQQMNVLLGRTDHGFVQVSFTAGYGLDVFEFDNQRIGDAQWKKLGTLKHAKVVSGKPIPFRLSIAKSKLSIAIDGKKALDADAGDHAMRGAFGLGAQASSAGAWRKITLKKS